MKLLKTKQEIESQINTSWDLLSIIGLTISMTVTIKLFTNPTEDARLPSLLIAGILMIIVHGIILIKRGKNLENNLLQMRNPYQAQLYAIECALGLTPDKPPSRCHINDILASMEGRNFLKEVSTDILLGYLYGDILLSPSALRLAIEMLAHQSPAFLQHLMSTQGFDPTTSKYSPLHAFVEEIPYVSGDKTHDAVNTLDFLLKKLEVDKTRVDNAKLTAYDHFKRLLSTGNFTPSQIVEIDKLLNPEEEIPKLPTPAETAAAETPSDTITLAGAPHVNLDPTTPQDVGRRILMDDPDDIADEESQPGN